MPVATILFHEPLPCPMLPFRRTGLFTVDPAHHARRFNAVRGDDGVAHRIRAAVAHVSDSRPVMLHAERVVFRVRHRVFDSRIPECQGDPPLDATVFGGVTVPGSNFDTLKGCTAQEIGTNAYQGLVAADADISDHNGILNGWVLSPKGKAALLNAVDTTGRPLFLNNVAEGAVPMILGAKTLQSKGAYIADSTAAKKHVVGFAGDWSQAMYGTVEGVQIAISDQATLTDGSNTINLFQQNMFAVRAEIEVGFRCDTTVFNKLTKTEA